MPSKGAPMATSEEDFQKNSETEVPKPVPGAEADTVKAVGKDPEKLVPAKVKAYKKT